MGTSARRPSPYKIFNTTKTGSNIPSVALLMAGNASVGTKLLTRWPKTSNAFNAKYGRNSIATYLGNPTVHNYGALLFAPGFLRSLRTRNKFSATSVDQLAHHLAAYLMFGHQLLLPVPDLDRTKLFLILGANPAVSNGSMMTAPGMGRRLQEIRQRGGKVILIDPRYNETARFADRHLFIRPGTDVFCCWRYCTLFLTKG